MGKKRIWNILFILYCGVMLLLLFNRPGYIPGTPYWEQVRTNLNLVPFRTIKLYTGILADSKAHLSRIAKINLYGNVIMFLPLGFLLPRVFSKPKGLASVLLATTGIIICVELLQLFTLVGSCDVDDLILNVVGAAIGYLIFPIQNKGAA